jgi:hypoxanthine phosphoribosyltransferase
MSIKKVHYTWKDIEHMVNVINNLMFADNWRPDCIVGLTRGGLVPAVIMSNITGIPMFSLDVRFRDVSDKLDMGPESNLWMAEWAYGYDETGEYNPSKMLFKTSGDTTKNILILDDINDRGTTLQWIKKDWQSSCLPDSPAWEDVWHKNVRFATLIDNLGSEFTDVDYTAMEIDKRDNPVWVVFPWEGERNYGIN